MLRVARRPGTAGRTCGKAAGGSGHARGFGAAQAPCGPRPRGADPVLQVGVGGVAGAVPAAGEKAEKKEMGREPGSREGRVCCWDGEGPDPAVPPRS